MPNRKSTLPIRDDGSAFAIPIAFSTSAQPDLIRSSIGHPAALLTSIGSAFPADTVGTPQSLLYQRLGFPYAQAWRFVGASTTGHNLPPNVVMSTTLPVREAVMRLLNRNQWCQVRPRSTTPGVKKSGKTSLCCKLLPTSARHIGFSISHRGPKTHNPRTQVLYVVPHPTQTTVVPDTHALVGVLPSTTSRRSITPKRAARHMHGLTSSTAPSVGEVEVLVWPRRPTPECRTS